MDRQDYENQMISVYWWNFGKKTRDFKGTYKAYLAAKDIEVTEIQNGDNKGYHFKILLSGTIATLDTYQNFGHACDDAIKVFLTLMGDRAKLITPYREFNIN